MDWPLWFAMAMVYILVACLTLAVCGDEAEAVWWPFALIKYLIRTFISVAFTGWR